MPTTKQFDFKIGTDPEFILTMQGHKVDAQQTMSLMLKQAKELRLGNGGFDLKGHGNIGWDGASSTGEVRPNADNNPKEVVSNLYALFSILTKYIKLCDLSTISEYSSCMFWHPCMFW